MTGTRGVSLVSLWILLSKQECSFVLQRASEITKRTDLRVSPQNLTQEKLYLGFLKTEEVHKLCLNLSSRHLPGPASHYLCLERCVFIVVCAQLYPDLKLALDVLQNSVMPLRVLVVPKTAQCFLHISIKKMMPKPPQHTHYLGSLWIH